MELDIAIEAAWPAGTDWEALAETTVETPAAGAPERTNSATEIIYGNSALKACELYGNAAYSLRAYGSRNA